MDATTAAIIGAAVGSGVTGVFGFITIQLQRRSEERRQIRELAVRAAIENWTRDFELAKLRAERCFSHLTFTLFTRCTWSLLLMAASRLPRRFERISAKLWL